MGCETCAFAATKSPVSAVDPDGGYSWFGAFWRSCQLPLKWPY